MLKGGWEGKAGRQGGRESRIKVWIDEGYGYGGMTVASKRALLAEMMFWVEGGIVQGV
jgi:hypothetical protein